MFGIVMLLDFVLHRLSKSNTSISTVRPMRRFMSPSPSGINAISQHRNQFFLREAIIACVGLITVCGRLKYGGTPGHDTYINPLPKMKMIPRLTTALLYNAYHFFLVFYPKTVSSSPVVLFRALFSHTISAVCGLHVISLSCEVVTFVLGTVSNGSP